MARRIVRLEPVHDRAFRTAVAPITPAIERSLDSAVLASRAWDRGRVPIVRLEPWRPARRTWSAVLRTAFEHAPVTIVADVRHCYASIRPDLLERRLRVLGAERDQVVAVRAILEAIGAHGLPVGPDPSAILANAVLAELDEAMRASCVPHLRWVDDIVAFARTRREARSALDRLLRAMDAVGLEPHPGKTGIVADAAASRRRLSGRPSTAAGPRVR